MRTIVILEITHNKPIPLLADKAAARAYNIDGVLDAEVMTLESLLQSLERQARKEAAL